MYLVAVQLRLFIIIKVAGSYSTVQHKPLIINLTVYKTLLQ